MKGRIYIGYPCVGKTSISGKDNFIDLDSSTMFINPDGMGYEWVRPEKWEEIYVGVALTLIKQGYNVFLSSHYLVTNYLKSIGEPFVVIAPALKLAEDWKKRARNRYERSSSDKDMRALKRIIEHYDEDVADLFLLPGDKIIIDSVDYDLRDRIKDYESTLKN